MGNYVLIYVIWIGLIMGMYEFLNKNKGGVRK